MLNTFVATSVNPITSHLYNVISICTMQNHTLSRNVVLKKGQRMLAIFGLECFRDSKALHLHLLTFHSQLPS